MLSYLPFGKSKSKTDEVKKEETEQSAEPAPAASSPPPLTEPDVAESTPATSEPITLPTSPTKIEAEMMSPVLSPLDEKFLQSRLEESEEEPPVVILEGNSGATTPKAEIAEPEKKEEKKEEKELTEEEKVKKKNRTDEWKNELQTRWTGLRRTVSSAAEKRRAKSKSKSPGPSKKDKGKGKEPIEPVQEEATKVDKGKEKEVAVEEKKEEEKTEEEKEADELTAALDQLNLAAENGRAFSVSKETKEMLDRFTQILKDLVNGVPTAYDDLTSFLDSSSKQLEQTFTALPSFLQKIVATLPNKMTKNLSPELLRTFAAAAPAAAAQGEKLAAVPTLKELVTKPGMVLGLLKSVVNVLKTRFPALLGANLALSLGLTVLLFILWYCYKRGKEERLSKEMEEVERKVQEIERENELEETAMKVPAGSPEPVVIEPEGKIA